MKPEGFDRDIEICSVHEVESLCVCVIIWFIGKPTNASLTQLHTDQDRRVSPGGEVSQTRRFQSVLLTGRHGIGLRIRVRSLTEATKDGQTSGNERPNASEAALDGATSLVSFFFQGPVTPGRFIKTRSTREAGS